MALPFALNPLGVNRNKDIPLTFTLLDNARTWIRLSIAGTVNTYGLKYRLGISGEWLTLTPGTLIYVDPASSIQFLNTNSTLGTSATNYANFNMGGKFQASGNVMSLLNFSDTCPDGCFTYLFANNKNIVKAPDLPALILSERCYQGMFNGCTSLIESPVLPAVTLASNCYINMFRGCTALVNANDILARTLATGCCNAMFYGCSALVNAPELLANTLTTACYQYMFYGCSALSTMNVNFTSWLTDATANWMSATPGTGTFTKPSALEALTGNSNIRSGWTINNK